jgi:23S rRNA G2445 N2-methylase RlmL
MNNFFVSCPKGLEEVLKQESLKFELSRREVSNGGIKIRGELNHVLTFMMESRIASRFFKEIALIDFTHEKKLLEAAKEVPWTKIMNVEQTFKVQCLLSQEVRKDFRNSHYLSLVLKDAITDTFTEKVDKRPNINLDNPHYSLLLRIDKGRKKRYHGTILVDLAGRPLHQRGYREVAHDAPIKENLAAGLVMLSDWDKKSPFYDVFCGSGTILLEAAYIKYNIPAAYLRIKSFLKGEDEFDLVHQNWFKSDGQAKIVLMNLCKELVVRAENSIKKMQPDEFFGSDSAQKCIRLSSYAWKRAGFPQTSLSLEQVDALEAKPQQPGTLISNPPYGIRLEESESLKVLYYEFGENLKKNWGGCDAYIITQDAYLRKKISLRTEKRVPLWNGGIECRFLKYSLY